MLDSLDSDLSDPKAANCGAPNSKDVGAGVANDRADESGAAIIPFPHRLQNVDPLHTVEFLKAADAEIRACQGVFASVDQKFIVEAMARMGYDSNALLERLEFLKSTVASYSALGREI